MWNPLIKFKISNISLRMASLLLKKKLTYIDGIGIAIVLYKQHEKKKEKK